VIGVFTRRGPGVVAAAWVWSFSAAAIAAPPTLRGFGVDEAMGEPPRLSPIVAALPARPSDLPLFVRLRVPREVVEPRPGEVELEALSERLAANSRLGVQVVLDLGALPASEDEGALASWRALVRAVARRGQGRVRAYQFALASGGSARAADLALRLAAVEVRAADPSALVVLGGLGTLSSAERRAVYTESLAPYVDAVALDAKEEGASEGRVALDLEDLLNAVDADAGLVMGGIELGTDPGPGVRTYLRYEFEHLSTRLRLAIYDGSPQALAAVVRAAAALGDALYGEVVTLDEGASELSLKGEGGASVPLSVHRRLLYNTRRFATYLAYWSEDGGTGPLEVSLKEPTGRAPVVRDGLANTVSKPRAFAWDAAATRAALSVPLQASPLLLDFNYAGGETQAARVEVTEKALPTVGEIIYRHQQVQAAQDAALQSYTAEVRMEQHFRASSTDSGWDVVTENLLFADKGTVEWEERSFILNGSRWGKDRPPFPLLQPEKVLSLPLDLRLSADYAYRLEGTGTEEGRACYVVHFDPINNEKALYRGTVWIDSETFEKVKLQAVQTRPGAPVLSNEETHVFGAAGSAGGRRIQLLRSLTSRQIILVAGRNLLLERLVRFESYNVNPPDFAERRAEARRGENIMYRDTDQGLRYLVKRGEERVVSDRATTSAKALAFGTVVDPSYQYPLPIVGLNYLDFDFLGKDNQLALLFGGVLALANVQRPHLLGPHVDGSVDLFAIAVPSQDQVFRAEEDLAGKELKTLPFSTGLNLGYQFTAFQKLSVSYQLRYDHYGRDDETAPDFTVPVSTFTNGLGLTYEYRRGGYTFQANGALYRRASWEPWGGPGDYDQAQQDYAKYGASLAKDFFAGVQKFRLNLAYFGGQDLDRFSMYQFGLFDETRIHGVPSARVRFPELAMVRGSYSLNLFELYRLDVFVDQALGRDPYDRKEWHNITGLGLGFNLRGPFRTLVKGEFGKSFLPAVYSKAGSYNLQITFFKPL
jgi:hypothetical protein